ncbi:NAD(P)-dependent oxidoreductase [Amycolatopsis sp. YIM 10]|uniref:NAD(P)-dependent oxidoreductase n=1 Tax=Amycolatopsis sp. YIM 10 TaxID=2653857 RepID=UPI0012A85C45|nr:NAD(P)-dependent oxidoreductase [Amycolatopsis sp. YIM 10]QFU86922.1 hypothetical protein YIM_08560 [Amycolatopsis sp. YIM 10]
MVLAAGAGVLREPVAPVFEAIGSRAVRVSERPGDGHRLKLAANAWVLSITAATAQSVRLAEDLGLDSPYAQLKGSAMIDGEYPPAFPAGGAAKDAGQDMAAVKRVFHRGKGSSTVDSKDHDRIRGAVTV